MLLANSVLEETVHLLHFALDSFCIQGLCASWGFQLSCVCEEEDP